MKTILFPTDFSEAAQNALNMAKVIAKKNNANIHLCHFYSLALNNYTSPESMIPMDLLDNIKDSALEEINKLKINLENEGFETQSTVSGGDLVFEILELSKQINADLIVMGTTGANNIINKLIGSNALSVMQRSECPIILVPNEYKQINNIEKIVFADHFDNDNTPVLKHVAAFADSLNVSSIDVLSVSVDYNFDVVKEESTINNLINLLDSNKTKLNFVSASNFLEGFNKYAETHQVDLLIMSTRKKSLLQRLFAHSETKVMAEHGKIPLMVYHV
jgi:nucleotide-binding universal stress UspA family protein